MQPKVQIQLDLGKLADIVGIGARRASSFMALGLRVAADASVKNVSLDSNYQIQFMPNELPIEKVREIQSSFRVWIIGNALRELDQMTSIFADRLFEARSLVEFNGRPVTQEVLDGIESFKNRTNVAAKLETIAARFGLSSKFQVHMAALSKARNALSHNAGVVGEKHGNQDGELRLSYIGFEMEVGGQVVAGEFEPIHVEKGQLIEIRTVEKCKTFPVGTLIDLSAHELQEICLGYHSLAQDLVKSFSDQLQTMGLIKPVPVSASQ